MAITHWIKGTLTLPPGTHIFRPLDLPAGITSSPSPIYSSVTVTDPANTALFKLEFFGGVPGGESQRDVWVGAHQIALYYTLTGGSDIDVDMSLVFTDDGDIPILSYTGA